MVFLFVFFFWDFYDSNVGAYNIVPEVSEIVLIFFFLIVVSVASVVYLMSLFLPPRSISYFPYN